MQYARNNSHSSFKSQPIVLNRIQWIASIIQYIISKEKGTLFMLEHLWALLHSFKTDLELNNNNDGFTRKNKRKSLKLHQLRYVLDRLKEGSICHSFNLITSNKTSHRLSLIVLMKQYTK